MDKKDKPVFIELLFRTNHHHGKTIFSKTIDLPVSVVTQLGQNHPKNKGKQGN
jgi:hypothetical protein